MPNFEIAIPTFERYNTINQQTLSLLKRHNIPNNKIRLFIVDAEQRSKYELGCGDTTYSIEITGKSGMKDSRNAMRTYYHESDLNLDFVVFMDDDLKEIIEKVDDKTVKNIEDFENMIFEMYDKTVREGLYFCGICAYDNPYFMKDTITTNLKFICGNFHLIVLGTDRPLLLTELGQFEDSVFTIKHFLNDGGVVRFNKYAVLTKYFSAGGMLAHLENIENRYAECRDNAEYLVKKYPLMCRKMEKKKRWDIKLNYRYKN